MAEANKQRLEAEARLNFQSYFKQLTQGCGRFPGACPNEHCASSSGFVLKEQRASMAAAIELARVHISKPQNMCRVVPHLTQTQLREVIQGCNEISNYDPFFQKLEPIFSSGDALDAEFVEDDVTQGDSTKGLAKKFSVKNLLEFYGLISSWLKENDEVDRFFNRCMKALRSEPKIPTKDSRSQVHRYLIYLMWPGLTESRFAADTHLFFLEISRLSKDEHQYFRSLLSQLTQSSFVGIVEKLHEYISINIVSSNTKPNDDTRVHACVLVMEQFYIANRDILYMESSEFYNDAICEKIDLRKDLSTWVIRDRRGKFCFCDHPFVLSLEMKSDIIQARNTYDMERVGMRSLFMQQTISSMYLILHIRRDNLIQDAIHSLLCVSSEADYQKKLKVLFNGEEGIDEGGVQKEFFQLICQELFDPKYGMFVTDSNSRSTWFNSHSLESTQEFELLGMITGLAIYNGNLLNLKFPTALYKKLVGMKVGREDLRDLNPDLADGLEALLKFEDDVESIFCRTFSVDTEAFGTIITHNLKPNGADIPVTNENREEFAELYIDFLLNESVKPQFEAFNRGFWRVVGPNFKMFQYDEIELLICGIQELDFDDLESGARYDGEYNAEHPIIRNLWSVLKEFGEDEKKKFLAFSTGSDRVPIKGLEDLHLTVVSTGTETDRLPTAHTCFNVLVLPKYPTREMLKEKLSVAIQYSLGFGLK